MTGSDPLTCGTIGATPTGGATSPSQPAIAGGAVGTGLPPLVDDWPGGGDRCAERLAHDRGGQSWSRSRVHPSAHHRP
jgi:hypothetical protein